MSQERRKAVAYLRTSSRTNVDKDSDKRQFAAIEAYAKAAALQIVATSSQSMPAARAL
jgi:DNA invertase Pin-like site-specific DNA recombinase